MILHEDKKLFKDAVLATAQRIGISEIYIEKDYWVTYTLKTLFNHPIGAEIVFKGGTALSKCYGLIERFSEDIDLVVLRKEGETNNQLTKKLRKISDVVNSVLPEIEMPGVTQKRGMNRKTVHFYAKEFTGIYGQVRESIIVEATWLGHFEPYAKKKLSSYIYETMTLTSQLEIAEQNELLPFDIFVLDPKRTLCEKIMSMVRFSYTEEPIDDLRKKIRHTYDLHQMLQNESLLSFFNSEEFITMLLKVANDDVISFKNNNDWLKYHPIKSLIFSDPESVWNKLKTTYKEDFKILVFGDFPDESKILDTLKLIRERISSIEWTINL